MNSTGLYPRTHIDQARVGAIGQAGGVLLTETILVDLDATLVTADFRERTSRADV